MPSISDIIITVVVHVGEWEIYSAGFGFDKRCPRSLDIR